MTHFELYPFSKSPLWEKEVEKIFDVFSRSEYYAPAFEILEEEKWYTISLDIPGLRKDEIELEVKEDRLLVTGERKAAGERENVLRSVRRFGKFERAFTLPKNVNPDLIEARFENGVLDIRLPKEEKSQTKKITISDWSAEKGPH